MAKSRHPECLPDVSDRDIFLRLLGYLKPYKNRLIIAMLVSIPVSLINAGTAWVIGPVLDMLTKGAENGNKLILLIPLVVVGANIIQSVFEYIGNYLTNQVGLSITRNMRQDLFGSLVRMDLTYFKNTKSGQLMTRYYRDANSMQKAIVSNLKGAVVQFFNALFLAALLFYRDWFLALVSILVISLIGIPIYFISRKLRRLDSEMAVVHAQVVNRYVEVIVAVREIILFNLQKYEQKRFNKAVQDLYETTIRIVKTEIVLKPLMQIIAAIGVTMILVLGVIRIQSGTMTLGDCVSFLVGLILLYKPVKTLAGLFGKTQPILVNARRVFEVLDKQPELQTTGNANTLETIQTITFENASFAYTPDTPVLKKINLAVNAGEKIALIGPSGGGKSTLVDLIPRLIDVNQGRVCVNGHDVKTINLHQLRQKIAIVSQDTVLFDGTIRENLLLGRFSASEEDVQQALDIANLRDFVESTTDGLNTVVGERGVLLSGGQKQRVAIARAFLKDAPILILDEATSALDNETEALVQDAMKKIMVGKTVFIIAHRLSTTTFADRLIVLNEGRVHESGTHDELMAKKGIYHHLYKLQFPDLDAGDISTQYSLST